MRNTKLLIPVIITSLLLSSSYFVQAKKIVIGSGKLTMEQPDVNDFPPITLTGDVQTATSNIGAFEITDARGTGEGWKIMVSATQFKDNATQKTIPQDSIELLTPSVAAKSGSSDISTIFSSSGTIDDPVGLKMFSASRNGGMGKFTVNTVPIKITLLPKNTYAGTYTSTLTFNIVGGP